MDIPIIDLKATGLNIVNLMDRCNITVRQLQGVLGFTEPQAIYKWRWGKSLPSLDNLVILAKVFNTSMDEIIVIK